MGIAKLRTIIQDILEVDELLVKLNELGGRGNIASGDKLVSQPKFSTVSHD